MRDSGALVNAGHSTQLFYSSSDGNLRHYFDAFPTYFNVGIATEWWAQSMSIRCVQAFTARPYPKISFNTAARR